MFRCVFGRTPLLQCDLFDIRLGDSDRQSFFRCFGRYTFCSHFSGIWSQIAATLFALCVLNLYLLFIRLVVSFWSSAAYLLIITTRHTPRHLFLVAINYRRGYTILSRRRRESRSWPSCPWPCRRFFAFIKSKWIKKKDKDIFRSNKFRSNCRSVANPSTTFSRPSSCNGRMADQVWAPL